MPIVPYRELKSYKELKEEVGLPRLIIMLCLIVALIIAIIIFYPSGSDVKEIQPIYENDESDNVKLGASSIFCRK